MDENSLESERREALLKAIPDIIFLLSYDGTYLDFRGGNGMVFIPNDKIIGSSIYDSAMPRPLIDQIMAHVRHAIDHNELHELNYSLTFPDSGIRFYESRAVRYAEGQAVRIVRDVTERIQDQERLKDYLTRLERFAFLTSHELRGPVTTILGLTSLFDLKPLPHEEREYVKRISEAADQLDTITRQMQQLLEE